MSIKGETSPYRGETSPYRGVDGVGYYIYGVVWCPQAGMTDDEVKAQGHIVTMEKSLSLNDATSRAGSLNNETKGAAGYYRSVVLTAKEIRDMLVRHDELVVLSKERLSELHKGEEAECDNDT